MVAPIGCSLPTESNVRFALTGVLPAAAMAATTLSTVAPAAAAALVAAVTWAGSTLEPGPASAVTAAATLAGEAPAAPAAVLAARLATPARGWLPSMSTFICQAFGPVLTKYWVITWALPWLSKMLVEVDEL
ncbi:hypothetical protein FQZ97_909190 [compost metagenome]